MLLGTGHSRFWRALAAGLALSALIAPSLLRGREEPSVEEQKERVANAPVGDRPALCIHISERQLSVADRLYIAGDSEKALAALADVVAYAELARDYAIQSHKHEKQSEIAIRKMVRKLTDMSHAVSHEDQARIQDAIDRMQKIRDDLLVAMFPKVDKKK
ncbi:MAG: hypothetical protein WBW31_08850 [Candidatus Sulfotelmatobacter sp.]